MQRIVFDKDDIPTGSPGSASNRALPATALQSKTIIVLSLVNNIEANIQKVTRFLKTLQSGFKDVWFAYLTNNNSDGTNKALEDLKKAFPSGKVGGIVVPDERIQVYTRTGAGNRTAVFARYRNTLLQFARDWMCKTPDYVLQVDTDLDLSGLTLDTFATFMQLPAPYGAICANGLYKDSPFFYDTFSLRLPNEPKEITKIYPLFQTGYGKNTSWVTTVHEFRAWTKVQSAFGGMMLLPRDTFESLDDAPYTVDIPGDECEHVSFCLKLKNPVYVNPHWAFHTKYTVAASPHPSPAIFVPRDAGFFSVFNFYIASLAAGYRRVYPSWTLEDFHRVNKTNTSQHFCYFSEKHSNAWLEYFKPVTFYASDTTMTQERQALQTLPITQGFEGPPEFRVPSATASLFTQADFAAWRQRTHTVFKNTVQLSDELNAVFTAKRDALFQERSRPVIGVHYRHPSHSCEEPRPLLFKDYFNAIDGLLKQHPNASILLSTDTDLGIAAFKNNYGSRIFCDPDVQRTSLDNILEWAYARGHGKVNAVGMINNKGYELQHTQNTQFHSKLGRDVVCDVMLLAQCDHFVHTVSNLALAVSYINPDIQMHYVTAHK